MSPQPEMPVAAAVFMSERMHFSEDLFIESGDSCYLYHPFYKWLQQVYTLAIDERQVQISTIIITQIVIL